MEHDSEITAEVILRKRRSRRKLELPAGVEISSSDARQINEAAAARFDKACNAGVWKRLTAPVLEPGNPFDPGAARRFRREAVVLGSLILAFFVLAVYFNVFAR